MGDKFISKRKKMGKIKISAHLEISCNFQNFLWTKISFEGLGSTNLAFCFDIHKATWDRLVAGGRHVFWPQRRLWKFLKATWIDFPSCVEMNYSDHKTLLYGWCACWNLQPTKPKFFERNFFVSKCYVISDIVCNSTHFIHYGVLVKLVQFSLKKLNQK